MASFKGAVEVAAIEGVTREQVISWCRRGEIEPARKVGGTWVIGFPYLLAPRRRHYPKGVKRPRNKGLA